jgi:hypothetical protein
MRKSDKPDQEISLRIVVIDPPAGVVFALQRELRRGERELVSPIMATGADLSFDLALRVRSEGDGPPNLLGSFVYGPRGERYIALVSGTLAGQADSCWIRGAKIKLQNITWDLIHQVEASPNTILEASIAGKAKDGGPACATVPLLDGGWRPVANP